jgi:hypothetical protein
MTLHSKRSTIKHTSDKEPGGSSVSVVRVVAENEVCFQKGFQIEEFVVPLAHDLKSPIQSQVRSAVLGTRLTDNSGLCLPVKLPCIRQ